MAAACASNPPSAVPIMSINQNADKHDIFPSRTQGQPVEGLTLLDCEQASNMSTLSRSTPLNFSHICSQTQNQKKRRRLQFDVECPEETGGDDELYNRPKKPKSHNKEKPSFIVKSKEMRAFFSLLEDGIIRSFLAHDICRRISDKYLLAMTFAYFKRANFSIREYNRINFFRALYLANDMEEDEEDLKYEIFPWALGPNWQQRYPSFLLKRDLLWRRIGYRAVVSKKCCDEVMAIEPDHLAWKRVRPDHHGGASRDYMRDPSDSLFPRGPNGSPRYCSQCDYSLEYDSASPDSISWYISSQDSSPGSPFQKVLVMQSVHSRFDMEGLKETLPDDLIWAHGEE